MSGNPDFKKVVIKNVEFNWPRLDQPYRYDPHNERSEACPAEAQGAGYSIAWVMQTADAKKLHGELKAHYADCKSRNSKLPDFHSVFGMKKLEDNLVQFTAKKRAMSNDGKTNKPPRVVGPDLQDLDDKAIWSGSTGNLRVLAFAATNPQDKSGGISLLLDSVQVMEAQYGSDNLEEDFGPPQTPDDPFETAADARRSVEDEF